MTAPMSQDLRERIAHAVEAGSSARAAAERFAVSASAAIKLMQRVRQTGSTARPRSAAIARPSRSRMPLRRGRSRPDPGAACRYAADDRDEQARDYAERDARCPTRPRHRRESALHHRRHAPPPRPVAQKKSLRAAEQDRPDVARHRRRWRVWQLYMDGDRFVFLDETGATTSMTRRYGWGERGDRLVDAVPYGPWKTTTFVAGLRASGIIAPFVLDGPMTGEAFRAYVEQVLAPALEPGDVVAMDNLAVHKVAGVQEAIRAAGASVLYLPSYSPDFNPIEQLFAKLKALLRKAAARTQTALWETIGRHLDDFTPEECRNYLAHCGYEL